VNHIPKPFRGIKGWVNERCVQRKYPEIHSSIMQVRAVENAVSCSLGDIVESGGLFTQCINMKVTIKLYNLCVLNWYQRLSYHLPS